jgi:endonuclease/exonuclease/phosphatase family metal-dependent hydrolase
VAGCSGSNGPDEEINQPEIDESDSATDEEQTKPVGDSTDEEDISLSKDDDRIRVGAFNVQIYGQSKASEEEVMDVLGDTIRTYDIVCIQEIRDKSQTSITDLIQEVNSENNNYDYVVSERLGRTSSKEQYMYIYNSSLITITGTPHTYPEPEGDVFHREPYIASFLVNNGNYDGVLISIHTDPDEATEEINQLDEVLEYTRGIYEGKQDFIIMGDFNADGSYFDEDGTSDLDEYAWLIDDSVDTTTKSTDYTYDRIVITDTSDYTGEAGVFRYDLEYGLDQDLTEDVSDHYPVYAEFWVHKDDDASTVSTYVPPADNNQEPAETEEEDMSPVEITEINLEDEWVKITNNGSSAVSLEGWKIMDEAEHTYTFPAFTLEAGDTITLYTEEGSDSATELYWGSGRPIWNNDGDSASLYNTEGEIVDVMQK